MVGQIDIIRWVYCTTFCFFCWEYPNYKAFDR